jgi:predicted  nucleic acid-binding Zn-ribbon protein
LSRHTDLLELHDIDLLLRTVQRESCATRLRRLGYRLEGIDALRRRRERAASRVEPRWIPTYERALSRYGRGLVAVRERVCQGCFITLPTSAAPDHGGTLTLCESCGRILYWP